jgi:hypothetical protein
MSAKLKEIIRINKVERLIWCIIFHKAVTVKFYLKRFAVQRSVRKPNRLSISGLSTGNLLLSIRKLVSPAISLNR